MGKIILCTQGTGKTSATSPIANIADIDVKYYDKDDPNWIELYVSDLIEATTKNDYVLGNITCEVMKELEKREIPYSVFVPFKNILDNREYQLSKQILFGRYILRKTQSPHNSNWIEKLKRHFDDYCDWSVPPYAQLHPENKYVFSPTLNTVEDLLASLPTF